jgi:hypothetical protein
VASLLLKKRLLMMFEIKQTLVFQKEASGHTNLFSRNGNFYGDKFILQAINHEFVCNYEFYKPTLQDF